jgi:uncharacterized membrane protein YphA (DoxX/SURF4 family)
MSTALRQETERRRPVAAAPSEVPIARGDPRYQAYLTLRIGFVALPLVMGIDKYFNLLTSWPQYLADWIDRIVPGTAQQFMYAVGAIEIAAGLLVAFRPRWGAYVVALWLGGIIINLVSYGEWYDVAVRDFGLMLGALALARLAAHYDRSPAGRG